MEFKCLSAGRDPLTSVVTNVVTALADNAGSTYSLRHGTSGINLTQKKTKASKSRSTSLWTNGSLTELNKTCSVSPKSWVLDVVIVSGHAHRCRAGVGAGRPNSSF
ncbi:hypothetical protein EVAR_33304_1 [Eumeta japonica]|uniref:Uncharacterized protein n=1 Tax=Eumeta variegata TaxID=151549 RepID=A0A4C1WFR3_EUMVA|nr:hypothetical protein EVAR_33304_1 [Eumeta japonica]